MGGPERPRRAQRTPKPRAAPRALTDVEDKEKTGLGWAGSGARTPNPKS